MSNALGVPACSEVSGTLTEKLNHADRCGKVMACIIGIVATGVEPGVDDSVLNAVGQQGPKKAAGGSPQCVGPGLVPKSEGVEERLFDHVPRQHRKLELCGNAPSQRRLAGAWDSRDEHKHANYDPTRPSANKTGEPLCGSDET